MKTLLRHLFRRLTRGHVPQPLITITLSRSALLHNLAEFKKLKPENSIFPVLKSNAYGHGLLEIAQILEGYTPLLIVDSYFEAAMLRANGITTPLLIMGYVRTDIMATSRLKKIAYTISSLEVLRSITSPASIHLKIDTGMNRQGIRPEEVDEACSIIKKAVHINLEGICSHFADADGQDPAFTHTQIKKWNEVVKKTRREFLHIKYWHISNTYGHTHTGVTDANSSRLGLGLYGLADMPHLSLKPVLEMKTVISSLKPIKKGEKVGYGITYTAEKDMTLATIPAGYYEGIDRRLSNEGRVTVRGIVCPFVGRISMNISTIDVSGIPEIKPEETVVIISREKAAPNSIEHITQTIKKHSDIIPYEIAVHIPAHLKRVVIE